MRYETDLTDEKWELVEPFVRQKPGPGAKRKVDIREVVNAIFYQNRTGCQWRLLPKDFPPRSTVHYYYSKWREDGTWNRINEALVKRAREERGRSPEPSLGIGDSQSVKTTEVGGERGIDGYKKVKGRKRQILTDSQGLLLTAVVHPAHVPDAIGGRGTIGLWSRAVDGDGNDSHGAGAVRFDTKIEGGPAGEGGERIYNYVRLVRDASGSTPDTPSRLYLPIITAD